jgi:hypothetical protein
MKKSLIVISAVMFFLGFSGAASAYTAYSDDLGHPIRQDDGHVFRQAGQGRSGATLGMSYLSHAGGGVKAARVFRIEPPVSVT